MSLTEYITSIFKGNEDGHDVQHTLRVTKYAEEIASKEGANVEVCTLAAMLHDVDDSKLFVNSNNAEKWLKDNRPELLEEVMEVIETLSYHKHLTPKSLEGFVVQDADRLDALGREGVRRAFKYGRKHGRTDEGTIKFLHGERGLGLTVSTKTAKEIADRLKTEMLEEMNMHMGL